jgi:hypothetical protein
MRAKSCTAETLRCISWQKGVYKKPGRFSKPSVWWKKLTEQIKKRDKYRCLSCFSTKRLTCHHIIARDRGGVSVPDNLITLCVSCHDIIEPLQLSRAEIIGFGERQQQEVEPEKVEPEKPTGINDWHCWVYGGNRCGVDYLA